MPLSAKSLHKSGSISDKQMAKLQVLRGTKAQKSKMAPFMQKTKDEGHQNNKGIPEARVNQINGPAQDKGGKFGNPSKGGSAGTEGQYHVNEINRADKQTPKFPKEGTREQSHAAGMRVPAKAKAKRKQPSLPMYGKFGGRPA